ncbi:hypothetical protein PR048_032317 [Dryococelus australis]|uniref:Uncharacterized protein n=1 Tax=Dryococelus australis TaxID=614101 RepID=A0ABQ9G602_9NEOP|nr:hypothetical protein PR048_032317 [Dryococelus australis]
MLKPSLTSLEKGVCMRGSPNSIQEAWFRGSGRSSPSAREGRLGRRRSSPSPGLGSQLRRRYANVGLVMYQLSLRWTACLITPSNIEPGHERDCNNTLRKASCRNPLHRPVIGAEYVKQRADIGQHHPAYIGRGELGTPPCILRRQICMMHLQHIFLPVCEIPSCADSAAPPSHSKGCGLCAPPLTPPPPRQRPRARLAITGAKLEPPPPPSGLSGQPIAAHIRARKTVISQYVLLDAKSFPRTGTYNPTPTPYPGFEPRASSTPDRWRTNQLRHGRSAALYDRSHDQHARTNGIITFIALHEKDRTCSVSSFRAGCALHTNLCKKFSCEVGISRKFGTRLASPRALAFHSAGVPKRGQSAYDEEGSLAATRARSLQHGERVMLAGSGARSSMVHESTPRASQEYSTCLYNLRHLTVPRAYLPTSKLPPREYGAAPGETGDIRENPPINGIVRGTIPTCENRVTWPGIEPKFSLVGGEWANRSATAAPVYVKVRTFETVLGMTILFARTSDEGQPGALVNKRRERVRQKTRMFAMAGRARGASVLTRRRVVHQQRFWSTTDCGRWVVERREGTKPPSDSIPSRQRAARSGLSEGCEGVKGGGRRQRQLVTARQHHRIPSDSSEILNCRQTSSELVRAGHAIKAPGTRTGFNPRPVLSGFLKVGIVPGRCRWSAGFLGDIPFPPPPSFRRCPILTSIALIETSLLRAARILFTHFKLAR